MLSSGFEPKLPVSVASPTRIVLPLNYDSVFVVRDLEGLPAEPCLD